MDTNSRPQLRTLPNTGGSETHRSNKATTANVRFPPIADISSPAHPPAMAEDRTYFDMTAEEVYGTFLSALAGLEDDAGIEGFSREGVEHLRAALQAFQAEYKQRHGSET